MKIRVFTRLMNDHGTNPRVRVMKHTDDAAILVYEGNPRNMDEEIQDMRVNSFYRPWDRIRRNSYKIIASRPGGYEGKEN